MSMRGIASSVSKVRASGVARVATAIALSTSLVLIGHAAPARALPRAIGRGTRVAAAVGTARALERGLGARRTRVAEPGVARVAATRAITGTIVLATPTVPIRLGFPRGVAHGTERLAMISVARLGFVDARGVGRLAAGPTADSAGLVRALPRAQALGKAPLTPLTARAIARATGTGRARIALIPVRILIPGRPTTLVPAPTGTEEPAP